MSRRTLGIAAALFALYTIWGSTYLAIAVLLETAPPLLSAALRFGLAGAVMVGVGLGSGGSRPTWAQWRQALGLGALFFLGGNGGVVYGETRVPSGLTALLIAMVPMWVAVLELAILGARPTARRLAGLVLGTVGIGVLVGGPGEGRVDPIGALLLTGSALSWATGTVAARRASLPTSSALASGMQMLGGGACLGLVGLATGELPAALALQPTVATVASFLWLMLGGSLVGFTAYQYLLRASTPAVASTYAYVNPIVAVFLGWWWAGEPLGPRVFAAGALIVGAVVLITTAAAPAQAPNEAVRASR